MNKQEQRQAIKAAKYHHADAHRFIEAMFKKGSTPKLLSESPKLAIAAQNLLNADYAYRKALNAHTRGTHFALTG